MKKVYRLLGYFILSIYLSVPSLSLAENNSFIDMNQRHVNLPAEVKRAVVIPIPAASLLASLDLGTQRLAGIHPFAKVAAQEGLLSRMFPAINQIASDTVGQGFSPNIETLLAAQPDLVWQWGHLGNDIVEPIVQAGLKVAIILYPYHDDSRMQQWITLMGISIGQMARARQMIEWRQQTLADVIKKTAHIPGAQKVRVLYLSRFLSEIQTIGSTSHTNSDIQRAGGVSITADFGGARTINQEQIMVWNPDIILLGNFEVGLLPEHIYQSPALAEVAAVKNRRVYKIPIGGFIWDAPNQETPLYWQWLAMTFYPDNIAWPLRAEIHRQYDFLYGYRPTSQDIDGVLQLEANKASERYHQQFKDGL
ncbi:periplasmic binding family protein [Yersinia ruckeri]|uniref:ABC transporter substrate-binding protein n=1 Tax=Yersinia ruckeri TaxID=29486 RepID=UPI0005ABF357|nr:ABC transporter substrate-binding protein [Yersinia ruckeri]AJI93834.1 periplasmic binding family protein [Yersinia ruckeri]MCW6568832.1 ABC transporter substrate-binding protein [Yersinia ruckeri]